MSETKMRGTFEECKICREENDKRPCPDCPDLSEHADFASSLPFGEQVHPVLVGRKDDRMYIQSGGRFVEIPMEYAKEVSIGIIMAIPNEE